MPHSAESLLQLLQQFPKRPNQVRQVHALIITNAHLLCKTQWKDTLLYNALIRAHLGFGKTHESLFLFSDMLAHGASPNSHTFAYVIKAAARSSLSLGPPIHGQATKRGVLRHPFVATSLVTLHAERGVLKDARKVFDEMPDKCLVARNAMIDAFFKNADVGSAVSLFEATPDSDRDVVTWTTAVNGLRVNSRFSEAVWFFRRMTARGSVRPNEATYVGVIGSCLGLDRLDLGKQVHAHMIRNTPTLTVNTVTALIDLYGKTGSLKPAENVFDQMKTTTTTKEVCFLNAMISAYSSNGQERKALALFDQMRSKKGRYPKPNEVTFVAILSACARAKLVELGLEIFGSMEAEFGVVPAMEHYGCVADMLGRAGLLGEAVEFVEKMPLEPDGSVLGAVLGGCEIHGSARIGDEVGRRLVELQRRRSGRYVVWSKINASAQRWDRAEELRKLMANVGVEKTPGYSLVAQ